MAKSIEVQLAEALESIKALTKENEGFKAAALTAQQESASAALVNLMTEAKLPEVAQVRLKAQFKDASKSEGMKEAVQAEAEYIKTLGGHVRKNNGAADNGGAAQEGAANEAASKAKLVESFQKNFGVDKAEAELMAE